MKLAAAVGTLSALYSFPLVSAAVRGFDGLKGKHTGNILPNAYIVELASSDDVNEFGGGVGNLRKRHDVFYQAMKERDVGFDVRTEWVDEIFTGVSISTSSEADASTILSMPGVVSIHPIRLYQMPKPVVSYDVVDNSSIPVYTPHVPTGVQKLQEQGILGAGVKVAVIDTGVDYNHPVLGPAGFGPGHKVIGGYDLVGDAYNGTNTPEPDDDPMDCAAHGTHVAGIIGANIESNPYGIVGVAPSASILAFRIFGCDGSAGDDVIIDALLMAKDAGVDVMNLSLGGSSGWQSSPTAVVASRIAETGIVMCIAAGNDGAEGAWYTSDPGSGSGIIAAASTDNTGVYFQQLNTSTGYGPITYSSFSYLDINGSWPVYVLTNSTTTTSDACEPLPDSTPDLSGQVVLIRRGNCTFVTKLNNAAKKGMQVALIYNNGGSFSSIEVGNYTAALISAEDGAYLFKEFFAGNNISVTFPKGPAHEIPYPQGGLLSNFSTFGPNYDMHLNPSVAAPGGLILSSVPNASYAVFSGTSMATPYLAGSSALVLEALGVTKDVGKKLKTLFQTTASFLGSTHNEADPYDTVIKQGSGLIQVYNVINYVTIVDRGEILLNDTAHFNNDNSIGFTNTGNTSLTYQIGHTPAATAMTFNTTTPQPNVGPVPLVPAYASVEFSESTFTLAPGQSTSISVKVTPPTGLDATLFPVYSGWVTATANNGEILSVLYVGLAANIIDMPILDKTNYYFKQLPPTILNATAEPQLGAENYTFGPLDYPTLLWRRTSGTALERIDLVPGDFNLSSAWQPIKRDGSLRKRAPGSFDALPIIGNLKNETYQPRHVADVGGYDYDLWDWLNTTLPDGRIVDDGPYRIMLSLLKITGDPTDVNDYDIYLSPIIGVNNQTNTTTG